MTLLLARIDDRLIHGQVVVGWCRRLQPDHLVLCDDAIAADSWERRVYASTVPPDIRCWIVGRDEAAALCDPSDGRIGPEEGVVLLAGSPGVFVDLVDRGVELPEVNVGGMHIGRGKREVLPDVYVDDADVKALLALRQRGIRVTARTVPGARETDLTPELLGGGT